MVSAQVEFRELLSLQKSLNIVEVVYSMEKNDQFLGGEFLLETMGAFAFC